jgi:mannose-6-phosphate isomerase-like protein (cupin superfamily)
MVAETATHPRVIDIKAGYESKEGFRLIKSPGKTNPDMVAPVLSRTPGNAQFNAVNLFEDGRGHHLVQLAEIEPGNRKYLHRHHHAETIWVILEGEGEYYPDPDTVVPIHGGMICHAYPWEWHGMGNTGSQPLRYISVEGPMMPRQGWSEFAE